MCSPKPPVIADCRTDADALCSGIIITVTGAFKVPFLPPLAATLLPA